MAFKNIPLTIDTMIRNPVPVEGINQEDNVELNIVVTENKTPKDLSSQTIKVYVRRIDGTLVEQTNQITPTNARKGEVTVKLKNSAFNKEGYALFQLDVSDSIGRITSSYATFKIGKGLVSSEAIANTNEVNALKQIEEYIRKANLEFPKYEEKINEFQFSVDSFGRENAILTKKMNDLNIEVREAVENLNFIDEDLYKTTENLFDFSKLIIGKIPELRIGATKDDFSTLSNWRTTNYIPVTANEQYCVIKNEVITQQQFTVVYFKDGINIGYDNPASNPFTIKEGADHIYICTGNSNLFIEDKTSVKKHEVDIDLSFKPFGKERQFALKDTVKETGVYIENSNYHHFVKFGDKYLIRTFKREGANNLFQFSSLSIGNVTKKGVTITKKIADNGTDIVGPISIMRQGTDSGGLWAGGYHDVGVAGSRFPTAQQESLKVTINGIDVTNVEGLHYGVVNITTKNKIYFPQTIVGSNLDSAIQSILETRNYTLNDKMNVNVKLDILQDTRVICYYGLQAVRIGFDNIFLPNDEKNIVFNEMNGDYWIEKPNRKVIMGSKDFTYELILKEYGLGNYNHNSGVSSYKFGSLPQNTRKYYQVLIAGDYEHTFLKKGTSLYWEGVYNIYPN